MGKNCQLVGWGGYTSVKMMNWGYQDNFRLLYFLQEDFACKKSTKSKKTQASDFPPLRCFFCAKKMLLFCFLVSVFFARNLFVKKQIKKSEIALIPSIHHTTYFNLFAFFSFLKNKFCTVQPSYIKKLNLSSETRELNWNFCSVRTQI